MVDHQLVVGSREDNEVTVLLLVQLVRAIGLHLYCDEDDRRSHQQNLLLAHMPHPWAAGQAAPASDKLEHPQNSFDHQLLQSNCFLTQELP